MILAILLISVFNTGLIIIMGGGVIATLKDYINCTKKQIIDRVDDDIEQLGTAIYNMDSLKQKARQCGKAEVE